MCDTEFEGKNFYLGFNKEMGDFLHVIPPSGYVLKLDPRHIKLISLGLPINDEYIDVNDTALKEALGVYEKQKELILTRLDAFYSDIKAHALPSRQLTFLDNPLSSPCGGSVGGVPFSFC